MSALGAAEVRAELHAQGGEVLPDAGQEGNELHGYIDRYDRSLDRLMICVYPCCFMRPY